MERSTAMATGVSIRTSLPAASRIISRCLPTRAAQRNRGAKATHNHSESQRTSGPGHPRAALPSHSTLRRHSPETSFRRSVASFRRTEPSRSEEHTSELQSPCNLVCRLLLEKKKKTTNTQVCVQLNGGQLSAT